MTKIATAQEYEVSDGIIVNYEGGPMPVAKRKALPVVAGLRPKQVLAAMMLVEGRMAKEVAQYLRVSPETVSRWRALPAFQALVRDMVQDSIDATKLGLLSLCSESIGHLRGLIRGMDDEMALKGITLLFSKAGPVLAAMSAEVERPVTGNPRN